MSFCQRNNIVEPVGPTAQFACCTSGLERDAKLIMTCFHRGQAPSVWPRVRRTVNQDSQWSVWRGDSLRNELGVSSQCDMFVRWKQITLELNKLDKGGEVENLCQLHYLLTIPSAFIVVFIKMFSTAGGPFDPDAWVFGRMIRCIWLEDWAGGR